jgi:hypothetical protein
MRAQETPGDSHARSLACEMKKHTSKVTTGKAGPTRRFLRNGFNGCFVLSLVNRAFLPPSPAQRASVVAVLTPASGRQDHTTSPSARPSLVNDGNSVHRIRAQRS